MPYKIGTSSRGYGNAYVSMFHNDDLRLLVIDRDEAVFTVSCRDDIKTGGHAVCYLEWAPGGRLQMIKYHLIAPNGRVHLSQMLVNQEHMNKIEEHFDTTKHYSYKISGHGARRVQDAFEKFDRKNAKGRYVYSRPGGHLGRVMGLLKGQRGVNCADLILKILSDAGIVHKHDRLFNTPRYAAGKSKR